MKWEVSAAEEDNTGAKAEEDAHDEPRSNPVIDSPPEERETSSTEGESSGDDDYIDEYRKAKRNQRTVSPPSRQVPVSEC